MQDFKYFTYGYSSDLRNPMYGLYQPVLNCFLIVFPDYDVVGQQLTAILSSRYLLQPIRLDVADNYTRNVIDNKVCENWTISNLYEISPTDIMAGVKITDLYHMLCGGLNNPFCNPLMNIQEQSVFQLMLFRICKEKRKRMKRQIKNCLTNSQPYQK